MNEPKYITRCRLTTNGEPCGHVVTHFPLQVQQIRQQPDARAQQLIGALIKHIAQRHPEAWKVIEADMQFFTGFMLLGMFLTEDPNLKQSVVGFGAHLRTITGMPSIPDEEFETELAKVGVTMEDPHRPAILELLRRTRDHYEGKMMVPAEQEPEKQLAIG